MNNELLHLIKKHTDTLIEQTKTKPQETPEYKLNKPRETFSFFSYNLSEEGKSPLAVTDFEVTNSVFNKTDENNNFSFNKPGYWRIPYYLEDGIKHKRYIY